ncbi:hypothetical protein [Brevundimonas sp.]|uniref:hypothetical protein n=1 Tax=Brevundimonas sp. TaxID=1871086 RepID=UPI002FCA5524
MRAVAILLASCLLGSCASASHFPPSLLAAVEPCSYGDGVPVMDDFRSDWYSSHLRAAGEPRLGQGAPAYQTGGVGVLRLTWLRSFDAPVIVRVEATTDHRLKLVGKELSGAGGYEPGRVARKVERLLSADETAHLTALLADTRVLDLPPVEDCPAQADGSIIGRADGARWIIEANGSDGYRFIDRWSAEGPVRALGLRLIGLTGWTYDRIY